MRHVLITGASRGIGLELAKQELHSGAKVYANCRSPEKADCLNQLKGDFPNELIIDQLDVESEESIKILAERFKNDNVPIDVLYNNAGIIDWRNLYQVDADSMARIYMVNVVGAMLVIRNFVPNLKQGKRKLIINISSRLGSIALRGQSQLEGSIAYSTSKAALNMLTKQASIDLSPDGICVISISPGWVRTEMGGPEANYSVEESVEKILRNVSKFEPEDSGKFFGENGEELPW